jgi:lysine biosynthesis protein LysW
VYDHRENEITSRVYPMQGFCPECDANIEFSSDADLGERLRCQVCQAYLVVIGTQPIELDWVYIEDQLRVGGQEVES